MFCDKCGTENRDEAEFCINCGEKLSDIRNSLSGSADKPAPSSGGGDFIERFKDAVSDRYEVIRELGRGGMAIVFLAKDKRLERQVALKLLPQEISLDKNFSERFMREARISAKLSHPSIIQIHDVDKLDEFTYYSMSFIDGISLAEIIKKSGALNPKIVTRLGIQICSALQTAHDQGVIHRDIKPENIIVSKKRIPIVVDFGIARAMSDSRLSSTGMFIGTPLYMSPEQIKSGEVDNRSDIYSMGGVLYEMAVGQTTFLEHDTSSLMYKQVHEMPAPPHERNPNVPLALSDIIMKALSKDPADRPESAMTLGKMLHEAYQNPEMAVSRDEAAKVQSQSVAPTADEIADAVEAELVGEDSDKTMLMSKPPKSEKTIDESATPAKQKSSEDDGDTKVIKAPQKKKKKAAKEEEKKGIPLFYLGLIIFGISTIVALGALSFLKSSRLPSPLPQEEQAEAPAAPESAEKETPPATPSSEDSAPEIKKPPVRPRTLERQDKPSAAQPSRLPETKSTVPEPVASQQTPEPSQSEPAASVPIQRPRTVDSRPKTAAEETSSTPSSPVERQVPETGGERSTQSETPAPAPVDRTAAASREIPSAPVREAEPVKKTPSPVEKISVDWVRIPGGTFSMGDFLGDLPSQVQCTPVHEVTVSPFELSRTEVTVREYALFLTATNRTPPDHWQEQLLNPERPVIYVTWKDADTFARWAGGRLPTEAEWEFAARGGVERQKYPWGIDSPAGRANLGHDWAGGNGWRQYLQKPGQYAPNNYGLYDMAGNVWEWTADWFGPYHASRAINPSGSKTGNMKVIRGGGWNSADNFVRNAMRGPTSPAKKDAHIGFRIARNTR